MIRKQLSVFLANRPGALSRISSAFDENNINILGITVSDTVDHAVVRLIVDDADRALALLEEANLLVLEEDVLEASLPNVPGSFAAFAAKLAEENINIDYAYGSNPSGENQEGVLYIHVSDLHQAQKILEHHKKENSH